ncbi:hypothetical protein [Clostridium vincentii]|uniref:Uncharacterized protein n=1 Tax=Clostridium vincentii TaxID=52704 RepID=A0A2T0BHA4_9CLOT|nr:hypothetical protein [Clostridium vincentii]PRR83245.1 hypothetical protein CLVI_10440 [Clostridium vincentii]
MIENFSSEVNSKLESDEIIEKSFVSKNYDMIERIPDLTVGPHSFIMTYDYSFKYSFVITNKRVFIGNMNSFNLILSYKIYNREDIVNIDDFEDKKKVKLRYVVYTGGLIPIFIVLESFTNSTLTFLLSSFLSIGLIYILSKLINKFTKPDKSVKEISFKDGKKLIIILNDSSDLDSLKTQN